MISASYHLNPKLFFLCISDIWKCKRPEGQAGGTNNPLTAKCIFLLSNLLDKLKQTVTEMHMKYLTGDML